MHTEYLLDKWIVKNRLNMISGICRSGKTTFLQCLTSAIEGSQPEFLGHDLLSQSIRVLVLDYDFCWGDADLSTPPGCPTEYLERLIDDMQKDEESHVVLIIDSACSAFCKRFPENLPWENDNSFVGPITAELNRLCNERQITIIFTHYDNKKASGISGSTLWSRSHTQHLRIKDHILFVENCAFGADITPAPLLLSLVNGKLTATEFVEPEKADLHQTVKLLLDVLPFGHSNGLGVNQISDLSGLSKKQFSPVLQTMLTEGIVDCRIVGQKYCYFRL